MTDFATIINAITKENDYFNVDIPDTWLQGRTAFGGLSAACVVAAMQKYVDPTRLLRSMSVSFVAPVPAGQHQIQFRPLREGGSVSHLQGELLCDGQVATSVNAAFGKDLRSSLHKAGPSRPDNIRPPEECELTPYIPELTPTFTQNFDMRIHHGALPMTGADDADYGVWLRFREPTPITLSSLIALADMPPLPGMNRVTPPSAGSSLTWYLEFPEEATHTDPTGWWYFDYRCQASGNGYFNNYGTIWSPDGRPAMFTRQVAMVFEKS